MEEITCPTVVLPIAPEIAAVAANFPSQYPRDPGDRIVAATAVVNTLTLVTADELIRRSGAVRTTW